MILRTGLQEFPFCHLKGQNFPTIVVAVLKPKKCAPGFGIIRYRPYPFSIVKTHSGDAPSPVLNGVR